MGLWQFRKFIPVITACYPSLLLGALLVVKQWYSKCCCCKSFRTPELGIGGGLVMGVGSKKVKVPIESSGNSGSVG